MSKLAERLAKLSPEGRTDLLRRLNARAGSAAPEREGPTVGALTVCVGDGQNFRARLQREGDPRSLRLWKTERVPPPPGMIQIQVHAASLNFRDLMIALGVYPSLPDMPAVMGSDCAGTVVAVGERLDVYEIDGRSFAIEPSQVPEIGDEVVALTGKYMCPGSDFSPYINVFPFEVVKRPPNLGDEEAAGLPTAYLTAYYALHSVARLQPGERVLIHSAAGGVGQAAIQVAKWRGAEIIATAGTEAKRAYLRTQGIAHCLDSRTTDYADEVMAVTGGQGVDVILSSLAGDAIPLGLSLLAKFGRLVEIGKRAVFENQQLELGVFKSGLTLAVVDIGLFLTRPTRLAGILADIFALVESGELPPLASQSYQLAQIGEALAVMSKGEHIGKLTIPYRSQEVLVRVGGETPGAADDNATGRPP